MKNRNRLIAVADVLEWFAGTKGCDPVSAYGSIRHGEGLTQLLAIQAMTRSPIISNLTRLGTLTHDPPAGPRDVVLTVCGFPVTFRLARGVPTPESIELVAVDRAMASRRGETDLRDAKVAFVGVGSVGSAVAIALGHAGIGYATLLDPATFDPENVTRHAAGLDAIGRLKVDAVGDLLFLRRVRVNPVSADVTAIDRTALSDLLRGHDLVIASTDRQVAQFLANEACVELRVPALYIGAYAGAEAGEVVTALPGGPCYLCVASFRAGIPADFSPREKRRPYENADAKPMDAEVALSIDLAPLIATASAIALAVLTRDGSRAPLLDRPLTLVHSGRAPRTFQELFNEPFERLTARIQRVDPCPVCKYRTLAPEGEMNP